MALHRPPLICNRFEVVVLILLSFIISTRLVWLQIDQQPLQITDEFYTTGNQFKRSLGQSCQNGIDANFPYPQKTGNYSPLATGTISPGLESILMAICQFKRLTTEEYVGLAPIMIGSSAFLVAVTARILTSNWVGGFIAASVVLSRGSVIEGTHMASTNFFVQLMVSLVFLMAGLYLRSRDARWLPLVFIAALTTIIISPLFSLGTLIIATGLLVRTLNHAHRSKFVLHRSTLHFVSIISTLVIIPILIVLLKKIMPAATQPIGAVLRHLGVIGVNSASPHIVKTTFVTLLQEIKIQDFHLQSSIAIIAIAATWRRYLPRGSGSWALIVSLITLSSLSIDGSLRATFVSGVESFWPLEFKLTGALAPLEPIIVGIGAAYAWFAIRSLIIALFPGYSSPPGPHDRIK